MATYLVFLVAAAAIVEGVMAASVEEMLFQNFVSNYSKSYKDDPVIIGERFKVFQVSSS